jgi:hypothetical protein
MIATLRYRCECAENEVLSLVMILDVNATEEQFVWTMQQMWRDLKFEIAQHLNKGKDR